MDKLTFEKENQARIQRVNSSFGPTVGSLNKPGRILMGEGRLLKQGRRKPQLKAFFLFNDVLVYGSILLNGRWFKNQKIIPLEDIELEDMEDGETFQHQWLLRTRSKSFYVSASSSMEKRAWMDHINECRSNLLQGGSCQASNTFAVSWIPDHCAYKCMRCLRKFSTIIRRHHCRMCGFLVCNSCSKHRAVIPHIHPTERQRICTLCHKMKEEDEMSRLRGNSDGQSSEEGECSTEEKEEEEEDVEVKECSIKEEEEEEEEEEDYTPSSWLDTMSGTWGKMGPPIQCISQK
ncbi:pleckstrin homology domain-containing family F member 2-like [Parambassis ranga]|uniref:Pleckstrin homology domain-containing family F member 2-like n=1 Tax=Parambassis ranga TaxID=210632 RepID=A0A6P7IXB6_9TELE|nr:pleckstrin homology domain-containing family F member 2-like [Parambassis ranga]